MSNALVDNISNASGSMTTPTEYVVRGSAKVWANLNGTGTIALRGSLNVSSVVDNGTGDYTNNFSNAMATANYQVSHLFDGGTAVASAFSITPASGSLRYEGRRTDTFAAIDLEYANVSIHGDLA